MKLILASRGDLTNPKVWSGTQYNLYREFRAAADLAVQPLNWEFDRNLLRAYCRIWGKFFFIYNTSRDPLLNQIAEKKIARLFSDTKNKADFLLFISDYCLPEGISNKIPVAAYFDSFLVKQVDYFDNKKPGYKQFFRFYEKKNREYLEHMDLIFTQNEWTRQAIIDAYGIPESRIQNVGFGINTEPYFGEKPYEDELLVIVLRKGTEHYKGLFLLLAAFKLLKQRRPQARLAVVGTDLNYGTEGVVNYYGQPRATTVELFRKAALYVMPALHEPNGITYLEALANRTPIVGLDRFALPEFTGNGSWGFMAAEPDPNLLADTLEEALSDKERLRQMGIAGQKFVIDRYRWDIVAGKMISGMKAVLAAGPAV